MIIEGQKNKSNIVPVLLDKTIERKVDEEGEEVSFVCAKVPQGAVVIWRGSLSFGMSGQKIDANDTIWLGTCFNTQRQFIGHDG